MPDLKKGSDCCGCTACAAICSRKAISMVPDSLGFMYPAVDPEKCIECGACERVCAFNGEYKTPDNFGEPIPYGARLKDIDEVMKSRSGGAFVAFSDWILDKGGTVYGAGYKDHFVVAHKRAVTKEERDEFRGSKYVQSDLDGIFAQVKADLKEGRWVLFSGTGCQVAGLKSFLPKALQERLVTVDIVCHGVPSPRIWQDYIRYIEDKEKKVVIGVDFRNKKDFGWKDHRETFTLLKTKTGATIAKTYTYVFYRHIMQRPSCGVCHFCNLRRPADLTLADFWGWEKTNNTINRDNKGLSLILINSYKGNDLLRNTEERMYVFKTEIEHCLQPNLLHPTILNPLSDKFKEDYLKKGFKYVMFKYGNVGVRFRINKLIQVSQVQLADFRL